MQPKIYISGKITGLDPVVASGNFLLVEQKLKNIGANNIYNPLKEVDQQVPYDMQMEQCLGELRKCQMALFQQNWRDSPGAKEEFIEARKHGLHIRYDRPGDYIDIQNCFLNDQKHHICNPHY